MPYNQGNRSQRGQKTRYSARPAHKTRSKGGRKAAYINPAKFVNKNIVEKEATAYEAENTFDDFNFTEKLAENVRNAGYVTPSAIQDQTIPASMRGEDVIGLANTGTGKTAAFLLPILQNLSKERTAHSVLIMAPTRELAQQIDAEFRKFSLGMKLYSALVVGGVNINSQIRQIERGPQIIIGTPGRLLDLLNRRVLRTDGVTTLVLDEADRMLDMGFVNDIRTIVSTLSPERQTLCFSATMNPAVEAITQEFLINPVTISVKTTETNEHIYQDVVHYDHDGHKKEQLVEMLGRDDFEKVIVFGETKFGVQRLSDFLEGRGITSGAIHGNKTQGQRTRALKAFTNNVTNVLVATDVAARGLDIPNVSHVINFDIPQTYDDYVHRIGRTGRGGKKGTALTFVKKP